VSYFDMELLSLLKAIGDRICHQIPTRTYAADGTTCFVCLRCTGIYFGFLSGFLSQLTTKAKTNYRFNLIIGLFFVSLVFIDLIFIDKLHPSKNYYRYFCGYFSGLGLSLIIIPVYLDTFFFKERKSYSHNQYFWLPIAIVFSLIILFHDISTVWILNIAALLGLVSAGTIIFSTVLGRVIFLWIKRVDVIPIHYKISIQAAGVFLLAFAVYLFGFIPSEKRGIFNFIIVFIQHILKLKSEGV